MATQDKKTDKLDAPKKGEANASKTKKRADKVRLFSQVNINVPIPRELTMILPSLTLNSSESTSPTDESAADTLQAPTEAVRASTQDGQSTAPSDAQQDAQNDHDINIEETDSNGNLVTLTHSSSHHLSTKLHPVIHHITGGIPSTAGVPHQTGSHSPKNPVDSGTQQAPTTNQTTPHPPSQKHPQAPVTYVDETLQGKYGSLHVSKDGHYTFTLDPKSPAYILLQKQEPGTDTFTLHLSNGSKVIVHIPVQGHQDSPSIIGDLTGTVTEDHQVDSNGLISTSGKIDVVDPDHDESSVQAEKISGQFGTLTIDSKGHWQYQVDNSQSNIQALTSQTALHESFTIHTKDGTPQILNMTIGGEDDNAVISGVDTGTVTEDQTTHAQGQLLVTDSDLGEDHFQASQVIGQFGTLTITKDGAWSYDLDNSNPKVQALGQGATATETITVTSADGTQHQVTVTVNGTNDRPVVSGSSTGAVVEQGLNTSGTPDATGSLTATDLDTSDTITWAVNQPQGQFGTLSIDQQGHWHYQLDNSTGSATDKLAAGEHQSESFWITATDSAGASTPQKIVIDVQGSNDKPVVSAWTQLPAGKEDQPVTIKASDLLTHASDVDATDNLHVSNLHATHGHLVDNKDGTYTFTPDKDFNGEIRLTYDVIDGHGGSVSTQAKFDLTATPDNAQISYAATDNHQGGVTEDRYYIDTHDNLHFNGKLDIIDPDKGEAQFDINLGPQTYQGIGYDTKLGGHILIMQDGRYTYTIRDHQPLVQNLKQGETITDECVVKSQDGTPFTIKVNIHGTNDAPTLTAQTHSVTEDGASLSGQMVGQDVDHGASLTYSIANSVDGLTFNADGSYSFDPSHASYQTLAQGQTQTLSIPVTVTDEHGASATQNLEIVVTGTNDAATVAGVDTGDVHENQAGQNMSPDYAQPGMSKISHDALTTSGQLSIVDPDTNEAIFDTKGGVYSYHGQYGHLLLRGDGHWEYAVAAGQTDWQQKGASTTVGSTIDKLGAGETLTDTITIQTKDGTTHDIVVTIHGDNDAPYVSGDVQLNSGKEDLPQTLTQTELLANSLDVDHNDIGKLSVANLHADHGSILDNKDGTYTFTPDKNYNGQVHFTYDVKDAHGGTTHTGANTTLVATPDKAIISEVNTGSVIEDGPHATHNNGTTTELANGQLHVIDPDSGEDKFQYSQFGETRIHDPFGGMLRIDSAGNWGYSVDNAALQHLAQGQVETVTYRVHSFDGTAYDLNIDVVGTNDAPTVTKVVLSNGTEDTNYQMQASQFGFTDVDTGDTLHSIAITDLPPAAQGKFVLDGHDITAGQSIPAADISKLQFVPTPDFNGDVQFKFTVNDGHVDSQEATNTLHIDAVGDAATISGRDTGDVHEGHTYTAPDGTMSGGYVDDRSPDHMHGNVGKIWNDEIHTDGHLDIVDPDSGESHAQTGTYQGTLGHVILQSNGDWSYYASIGQDATGRKIDRLGQGESISDTVTVKSADGTTHDIHITIHGDNDRPYCSSEVQLNSGKEDLAQTITTAELLANTVDVDANDAGQLSIANLHADHGTLVDNKDGTFTFTPDHNFNGKVHFTYDVKDAHGGVTHTGASTTLLPSNDAATLPTSQAANSVTEDHLKSGTHSNELWSGWKNLDIQDIDSPSEAKVTQIEISGVKHTVPADFAMNLAGAHGTFNFTHSTDGHNKWSYSADNTHTEIQGLSSGESLTDTITLITADGTRIPLTATILGTDDHVVIDTPDALTAALGTAVEDKITSISGTLLAHDSDSKDSVTFNAGDSVGAYGTLHVDSNGQWHYDLDHSKANTLQQGETKAEGFDITATSTDGSTATKHIEVLVQGSNDDPMLSVTQTTSTTGTLTETDVDVKDTHTFSVTSSIGQFGTLSVDPGTGAYVYTANGSVAGMSYNAATHTYHGTDVFEVKVADNHGGESSRFMTFDTNGHVSVVPGQQPTVSTSVPVNPLITTTQPNLPPGTNTPPNNAVTVDLAASSDTGTSDTDNLTKDSTPTVIGHTDIPYSQVTIYDGSTPVGHAVSDGSGQYSVAVSSLSNGDHNLSAKALAPSSVLPATSSILSLHVDTVIAPLQVSLAHDTGSNSSDLITSDGSLTISGQETGATIEYSTDNGHTWTSSFTPQSGSNTVSVRQTDIAGNVSIPTSLTFTYDDQIAAPSIDLKASTDSGVSATDDLTNVHTPIITGTAEANSAISITDETGKVIASGTANSSGIYQLTTSDIAEGKHTLTVSSTDVAGNQSSASLPIEVDYTAPSISKVNLQTETTHQPTFSGTVSLDTTSVDIVIKSGSTIIETLHATLDGKGGYTVDATNLPDQSYTAYIQATDKAGNTTASGYAGTFDRFSVDTHASAPTISFESTGADNIYNAAEVASGAANTITSTIHLPSDAHPKDTLTINGQSHLITDAEFLAKSVNIEVAPGASVTASITDKNGNTSTITSATAPNADITVAPLQVSLTHDTGSNTSDLITNDGSLTITGQETGATVEYSIDNGHTWTSSFTPKQGSNTVSVRQTDTAGNVSTEASVSFTLDNTVNAPAVSLRNDTSRHSINTPDLITTDSRLSIQAEAGAKVEYSNDGGHTWTAVFNPVEGVNDLQVRQTDIAGNVSPATHFSFTLDTTPGTVTVNPISQDNALNAAENNQPLVITGTTSNIAPGDVVYVVVGNNHFYDATVKSDGTWSLTLNASEHQRIMATDRDYPIQVGTVDTAGNSTPRISTHLLIDTQSPIPHIAVDSVTQDNVLNAVESGQTIAITGTVTGDYHTGDIVSLKINGATISSLTGSVDASGHFSIPVAGSVLEHANIHTSYANGQSGSIHSIEATIITTDAAGNVGSATTGSQVFSVDTHVSLPTITFENPGSDGLYSKAEIAHGHPNTVTATITPPGDAKIGEHLVVNGQDHVLDAHTLQHGLQIEVSPGSQVQVTMTDEHGNTAGSQGVAASAIPEPIVVKPPSGSHQVSGTLGVPPLIPSQTPVPSAQNGWRIHLPNGQYVTSHHGQYGTLTIDPQTGHLHYQEQAQVHTGPHGSASSIGQHEDKFEISLQGANQDEVVAHVNVQILSHGPGHSGKLTIGTEVVDMTITPIVHATHPAPPPPPTMSQSDEVADADTLDVDITLSSVIDHNGTGEQHHVDPHRVSQTTQTASDEPQHGAAAYLSALGIEPTQAAVDAPVHTALPDDIDLVLADDMNSTDSSHLGLDDAATGAMQEASDQDHQHEELINPDEHHDQGDPSSFIDPY